MRRMWQGPKSRGGSFFGLVLIFGILFALLGISIGIGGSVRIPLTDINMSAGGSLGKKEDVKQVLPNYLKNRVGSNSDFFNQSTTLTIWKAEGIGMAVIAPQPEAPWVDLYLTLQR